jgi:hypothetical protein
LAEDGRDTYRIPVADETATDAGTARLITVTSRLALASSISEVDRRIERTGSVAICDFTVLSGTSVFPRL